MKRMKDRFRSYDFSNYYVIRNARNGLNELLSERITRIFSMILVFIILLGIFGPLLTPHDPDERHRGEDGDLLRLEGPSVTHPLGTTIDGQDVLSRVMVGARPTLLVGFMAGTMIISIGMTIGLISGYVGGRVDDALMRFTDLAYGVPLLPMAIVLLGMLELGFTAAILVIGILLWRASARVIRSQVLQIKERPFILAAKATGASTPRIIVKHILPNVAPMAILFFALGIGFAIIVEAGLSFLGLTDPFTPTWGLMIREAYQSGAIVSGWWWALGPSVMISLTVLSTFMIGRGFESSDSSAEETMATSI